MSDRDLPARQTDPSSEQTPIKLSICMATYNRGRFIGETLDSLLAQLVPGVELLVVDGASPDNTEEVMSQYLTRYPAIRYFREKENSGVDRDYDKAVGYACGEYCWLMTDDDLLHEGALACVLSALADGPDLVVVNSELKTVDMSTVLADGILKQTGNELYGKKDAEKFFVEIANYLSFIGGVVIKRQIWMERDRATYFGSLFIHVGVIFQKPLDMVRVIRRPSIAIRYGNAMWTPRGFEIWMFKWPKLVWSFIHYTPAARSVVRAQEPWRDMRRILMYRALGGYGLAEYQRLTALNLTRFACMAYAGIAVLPASLLNSLASVYCACINKKARSDLYDLSRSKHATWLSRALARSL